MPNVARSKSVKANDEGSAYGMHCEPINSTPYMEKTSCNGMVYKHATHARLPKLHTPY